MAVIATNYLTLADWAKRYEPNGDGKISIIVDLLSQTNEMVREMLWAEGNQTDGHLTNIRTGLPQGTWRMLYQGVQPTKSTTAQITERTGMLEAVSEMDKALADLNGNTVEFRLSEDAAFFEGLTQQMQEALIYSNSLTTPQQIMGFAPRYNTVNPATAATAANVIDAQGTGSTNTSMWLVGWGPNSCFGMFPKGQMAGLEHRDLGEQTKWLSDQSRYQVYSSQFIWRAGLCVRDWRYIVRICNIDVTLLSGVSAANLINAMVSAVHRLPTAPTSARITTDPTRPSSPIGATRWAFYCNRVIAAALDKQAMNKSNVLLRMEEWDGHPVTTFRGIPIRVVDRILNTEARIV